MKLFEQSRLEVVLVLVSKGLLIAYISPPDSSLLTLWYSKRQDRILESMELRQIHSKPETPFDEKPRIDLDHL